MQLRRSKPRNVLTGETVTWGTLEIPIYKILNNYLVNNKIKYYFRYISSNQISVMLLYYHNINFQKIEPNNWTHAIHGKCKKVKVWSLKSKFVKVLIRKQVFHNIYLIRNQVFQIIALGVFLFNFLFSRSIFRFYSLYLIVCEICDKNIFETKNLKN